jgi:hypothetical protein
MTVRLTESRLRQIIREELASLSTRPIREGIDTTRANVVAAKEGYTHYVDVEFHPSKEDLDRHGEGENLAYDPDIDLDLLIGKGFDELLGRPYNIDRVILIEKGDDGDLGKGTARFYGSKAQMYAVAAVAFPRSNAEYIVKEIPRV